MGFRFYSVGIRVDDSNFTARVLGLTSRGLGVSSFRVQASGLGVEGLGIRDQGFGFRVEGAQGPGSDRAGLVSEVGRAVVQLHPRVDLRRADLPVRAVRDSYTER